jgi:glycerophosphoryl diester phosphodiesterase
VDVICHRACPADGPENSIQALEAIPDWIDMVEIDVQRCASGELVVFHDRVLDRTTDGTGAIGGADWKHLRDRRLEGTKARIPRLETLVEALPEGLGLNVELKHAGVAADVATELSSLDRQVLVSSFVPQAIAPLSDRGFRTAHLIHPEQSSGWDTELAAAESIGADAVHPHVEAVGAAEIESAHDRGLAVNAWTAQDVATVTRLREAGVDGLIVDDPALCDE